jgi:hypothetical protein
MEGREWYQKAGEIGETIHPSPMVGAGVLAALSPNVHWDENVSGARIMCHYALTLARIMPTAGVAGYGMNRRKAWSILQGEYKDSPVECLNRHPRYKKTVNFFYNMLGDTDRVTIDRWVGLVCDPTVPAQTLRGKMYEAMEMAYQIAAGRIGGITPRDLQAVCWVHIRTQATKLSGL